MLHIPTHKVILTQRSIGGALGVTIVFGGQESLLGASHSGPTLISEPLPVIDPTDPVTLAKRQLGQLPPLLLMF